MTREGEKKKPSWVIRFSRWGLWVLVFFPVGGAAGAREREIPWIFKERRVNGSSSGTGTDKIGLVASFFCKKSSI